MYNSYVSHNLSIFTTYLLRTCNMTHVCVWNYSLIRVTWRIGMGDMTQIYCKNGGCKTLRVRWLVGTCDLTHSYEWHDSFIWVTWLIHMIDITRSYLSRDTCICVTRLIDVCDMTRWRVCHDSFVLVTCLIRVTWRMTQNDISNSCDIHVTNYMSTWLICMSRIRHVTNTNESCRHVTNTNSCDMTHDSN